MIQRLHSVADMQEKEAEWSPFPCRPLSGDFTAKGCDGSVMLCCKRAVYMPEESTQIWDLVRGAAQLSDQRGAAGGRLSTGNIPAGFRRRNSFTMRPTAGNYKKFIGNKVNSAVIGFTSRNTMSKWVRQNPNRFQKLLDVLRTCSEHYQSLAPAEHRRQLARLGQDRPPLPGTAFRSVYVNRNFRTALHKDKNTQHSEMGAMLVVGNFIGGEIQFPEYGVEVALQAGDLLLFRPDMWHCNKPLTSGERVSLVCHA